MARLSPKSGPRQYVLGLVQTAEGIPLYHEVFPGNTAEVMTLKGSILKVLERFPVRRVIAVADRGLLSLDNLQELRDVVLPSGEPLEFILAVPGRRYGEFAELLATVNKRAAGGRQPIRICRAAGTDRPCAPGAS